MVSVVFKRVLPCLLDSNNVGARNLRVAQELRGRNMVVSPTVSRQVHNTFDLLLACLAFCARRSMCALAIGALIFRCVTVFPWTIPRLMTLGTVHTFDSVITGGSNVTVLLAVETLAYTSSPVV